MGALVTYVFGILNERRKIQLDFVTAQIEKLDASKNLAKSSSF